MGSENTVTRRERQEGALVGFLVGDALGVPYELGRPSELPPAEAVEMRPPAYFHSHRGNVPPGTWSDEGSQALCLFASLWECGGLDLDDLGQRLLAWMGGGYMAVDSRPFDVGVCESEALTNFKAGVPAEKSGLAGSEGAGPGSLMRVLPLPLLWRGDDASLAEAAERQSLLTHAHPAALISCALYALWVRRELEGADHAFERAEEILREIHPGGPLRLALDEICGNGLPRREGAAACLLAARRVAEEADYERVVRSAVLCGHDAGTSAALAGAVAGARHGVQAVPERWWKVLRGKQLFVPILERWLGRS
jgi:ADP-ribosylglycohydrolase